MEIRYFVNKTTNTSADTLLAIGFASLLCQLSLKQHRNQDNIFLEDGGSSYIITIPQQIDLGKFSDEKLDFPMVLPLGSDKQKEKQKKKTTQQPLNGYDYDGEMEAARIYYAKAGKVPKDDEPSKPDPARWLYHAIIVMKVADSFNRLVFRWNMLSPAQKLWHMNLLLNLFSDPFNGIASAIEKWQALAKKCAIKEKAMVSALQILNPTMGKGTNRTKAGDLVMGNEESFWLLELLKFRGFMEGAASLTVKDSDDRKTYVIHPQKIKMFFLQEIIKRFRNVLWPATAVKLDILVSLRFAQELVKYYKEVYDQDPDRPPWLPQDISRLVSGFDVTFYKSLGSAYATMNISTIGLPRWLPDLINLEQAEAAEVLLKEHIQLIGLLRRNQKGEEGSEEYELLRFYRDFLSGNDLRPFWNFTTAYSSYLMSALEDARFIRPLTTQGLETIIMANTSGIKLAKITGDPGFKQIASAIRQATVRAQFRKSQQGDHAEVHYEVRYGLGQELMRKARYEKEFIAELASFLHLYNAETAREEEKLANRLKKTLAKEDRQKHKLRFPVSHTDIDAIVALIDEFGSETVCSLLVAYGYASEPRKGTSGHGDSSSQENLIDDALLRRRRRVSQSHGDSSSQENLIDDEGSQDTEE